MSVRLSLVALCLAVAACSGATTSDLTASSSGASGSSGSSGSSGATPSGPDTPPDVTFGGAAGGCSNVFLYRASADGAQFITIEADREKLGMKLGQKRTFDLAQATEGLTVGVDVFARAPSESQYCTDFRSDHQLPTPWRAEAGTLILELSENADANGIYRASVRLRDVRLVGPNRGTSVIVPKVELEDVRVGWLPG
ncbi:MAG: hypothetical protein KF819_01060 [Labilithrix sp.]|nr:hypothetical protein [Labilithrix sp.]